MDVLLLLGLDGAGDFVGRKLQVKRTLHLRVTLALLILYEIVMKPKATLHFLLPFLESAAGVFFGVEGAGPFFGGESV